MGVAGSLSSGAHMTSLHVMSGGGGGGDSFAPGEVSDVYCLMQCCSTWLQNVGYISTAL